jgi:hypothetical protein
MDEDANLRLGKALMVMVRHPRIIFQISGLMRNTRLAADNVANALIHALGSQEI